MRVCVDVLPLLVRSAGVKNYLYYWVSHLRELAGSQAIRLFPPLADLGPLDHEKSIAGPVRSLGGLASLALINYAGAPLHDWFAGADLFHSTNLIRVPPRRARLTTTVHDVTSWIFPELHSSANRRADQGFERMLRAADGVIAVSASTRDDVVRRLGVAEKKIEVIHSGVAERFFRVGAAEVEAAREALRLSRPYVLYVGAIEPRKNLEALLDAWGSLPATLREEFELVLAGPKGWAGAELLARLAAPPPGVRYLGYVPEEQIAGLTAGATVFVYPSLYEGFGFPVVQAMAAGAPVVTSAVSSLPEVTGDAASLVDPHSRAELAQAIESLLLSPSARQRRSLAGRAQAQRFTWTECARKSLDFFRRVHAAA